LKSRRHHFPFKRCFFLRCRVRAIFNFGGQPLSGNVDRGTGRSGLVENMEVVVGISMISHPIPGKTCLSVSAVVFQTNPLVLVT
jgi:hypothetical protein